MRFGLFCSAQANSNALGPETGQRFRDNLLTISGGPEQLRRFARDIVPAFAQARPPTPVAAAEPVTT